MPKIIWKENQVSVNDVKTHYLTGGSGELLLLIHGWPLCISHHSRDFLNNFALNFNVIAVDLPGFGSTEQPNFLPTVENYALHLKNLAQQLGIRKHAVMGWSFGGMVAIKYAFLNPNNINRLVLCGAAATEKYVVGGFLKNFYKSLSFFYERRPGFDSWLEKILKGKSLLPWFWEKILPADLNNETSIADLRKLPVSFSKHLFDSVLKTNLEKECLALSTIPTLILSGEEDKLMTVKAGDELDKFIGTSCFMIVPHAWHGSILTPDSLKIAFDFIKGKSVVK